MENQNRFVRIPIDEYNLLRDFKEYIDAGLTVEVSGTKKHIISFLEVEPYVKIYTTADAVKKLSEKIKEQIDWQTKQDESYRAALDKANKNESSHFKNMSLWDFFIWKITNRFKTKNK